MTPRSTDKLTTTASTTGSEAGEAVSSIEHPKASTTKPMGGMKKRKWAGRDIWICPRCGFDTFSEHEAKVHTCNGRVAKPYKGDNA